MNKKGFTLVELLAVIAIIALISLIAIPNIMGLSDGIKKDQMLDDAKRMISMAKYQVNKSYEIRISARHEFTLQDLNTNRDFVNDPDGAPYENGGVVYTNTESSGVKIVKYCVYLIGTRRRIGTSFDNCVYEENLYSRSNVNDK